MFLFSLLAGGQVCRGLGLFYRTNRIVKGDMEQLVSDTREEVVPKIREVA